MEYVPVPQSAQTVDEEAEYFPGSQLMQTDEPVVRAQRQTTSQIRIHMYICIEDVCVCTHIHVVCMYRTYE